MDQPRISASSYSNTAPLVWSFLYGSDHGKVELILDNAPARSAELLAAGRVDAALVPVIASQFIDGVRIVRDVCVGARDRVRSVCLITRGRELADVRSVALDTSSKTSAVLTRLIFREFLGFEPVWRDAAPDINAMLAESDAALIIGDPALALSSPPYKGEVDAALGGRGGSQSPKFKVFDLAELWHRYTGLGFIFAMWMTRHPELPMDLAAARDEGLAHIDEIAMNYSLSTGLGRDEMRVYLAENIRYSADESMLEGMELYFRLAAEHGLIPAIRPATFI